MILWESGACSKHPGIEMRYVACGVPGCCVAHFGCPICEEAAEAMRAAAGG